MGDYTPVNNVDSVTFTAASAITGGQVLVPIAAGTVGPSAGTAVRGIGVALHDAPSGGRVSVAVLPGAIHEVASVAGHTFNDAVTAGTGGQVASTTIALAGAAGTLIGIALTTVTTGNKVRFIGV